MPDDLKGLIPPLTTEQRERMAWLMDEEATGYRMVWQKMGGNDGTCAWVYYVDHPGYARCYACEITIEVPAGWPCLPSPWQRCAHMMKVRL